METPKEKAISLVQKYRQIELLKDFDGMDEELAIECAKIVANEVIKSVPMYVGNLNPQWKFWDDVKNELEKLKID